MWIRGGGFWHELVRGTQLHGFRGGGGESGMNWPEALSYMGSGGAWHELARSLQVLVQGGGVTLDCCAPYGPGSGLVMGCACRAQVQGCGLVMGCACRAQVQVAGW